MFERFDSDNQQEMIFKLVQNSTGITASLYNSLSFLSHSVSTRSFDLLVLSIPYVRSSLGKRVFSVIGPRLWNSLQGCTGYQVLSGIQPGIRYLVGSSILYLVESHIRYYPVHNHLLPNTAATDFHGI